MTVSSFIGALRRAAFLACLTAASLNVGAARAEGSTSAPMDKAQIEQLVAPIALYPDALLSQTLMASTYPLEVVEAARWSQQNPQITGPALEDAMQKQSWDPSVKALTAVPQTLQMMNDKLDWTQDLGDVFLARQQDVLDAVQRLRARADANGQLNSNEYQKVAKSERPAAPAGAAPATPIYSIAPASPGQYYVPVYNPTAVYGAWPYPAYTPFYWRPPGYVAGAALGFTAAAITGAAIWGGVNWGRNNVSVNVNNFNQFNRTNVGNGNTSWSHNPAHRGGVGYKDQGVAQRFGDQGRAAARESYRGKADAGRRDLNKPGGANLGQQGANRGQGANRAQQGAANRAGGQGGGKAKAATQPRQAGGAKQNAASKQGGQAGAGRQGAQSR